MQVYEEYPISVYSAGMIKIDDFLTYSSISITHSYRGLRTIEIKMQANVDGADNLTPPNYVAITTPSGTWGGVIYERSYSDSVDKNGRNKVLIIRACSPVGYFKKRYILESQAGLYSTSPFYKVSGTQEYVIKRFIEVVLSGAYTFPDFTIAPNLDRGKTLDFSSTYESLYSILQTVSNMSSTLSYDTQFSETDGFVFDMLSPSDLSDTVYFSSNQGVFQEFSHVTNFIEATNNAMLLTTFYLRVMGVYPAYPTTHEVKRVIQPEVTKDGYNLLSTILGIKQLYQYGTSEANIESLAAPYLNAYMEENKTDSYTAVLNADRQKFFFNKDFYLGDVVSLYYDDVDEHVDAQLRVIGAVETINQQHVYDIGFQFDREPGGLGMSLAHMKQQLERNMR